ncbi:MAG: helix-turn-helix domain-containing protein [Flavobacteriales bacterium]|nr:helix-turn-helix domain-containing protein [Flavobacteriales bacterium]
MLFSRDFYSSNQQKLQQFPFLNNNSKEPILNLGKVKFGILINLVGSIQTEQNSEDTLANDLTQAYLNTFLIHCKRYFKDEKKQHLLSNDSLSFRFKQLIEEQYLEIHNVSEYAAMLNSSEKQLSSATKKELGVSPKELIYNRIILEAKRLVLYTNYSFQEIAFFLSYSDASHFAKFFKRKTGFSPGNFREDGKKYL